MSSAFRQQEERRKAEREAERREAALEAKREEARERAREEEREAQREAERREAARAEAEAERKAAEKAAARRAAALARRRAETAALRREQAGAERRAEERAAVRQEQRREEEQAAARQERRREEERAAARQEQRREQQAGARRRDRLEQERAEQRAQERRQAAHADERAGQRIEERRGAARSEERTAQRDEGRAKQRAEERRAARADERARQRSEERQAARDLGRTEDGGHDRAEQRADERRQAARDERRSEEREQESRERARAERREQERQRDRSEQLRAGAAAERRADARERERRTAVRSSTLDVRKAADRAQARAAERRATALGERSSREGGGTSAGGGATADGRGGSGWLRVDGPRVVDATGAPVVLRGVTVRGLERPEPDGDAFAPALGADEAATLAAWGCTTITVPIAQDLALEGRGDAWGEDYLRALDATVANATSAGLRAIVQLSLLSSELPSAPGRFAPPVPDAGSIDLWAQVARRYAEEPAVLFDLFATPHDPEPGDWTALVMPQLTWPIWERWVIAMLGEVKRVHPRALAIVRGLGGRDLSYFPLAYADGSRIPNLLYAAELAGEPTGPLAALRRLARHAPVAASPWRAGTFDGRVVETLGRRLANLGAHWTAAGWREPEAPLTAQVAGRLAPTALGRAFQVALAQPAPASSLRAPRVGPVRGRSTTTPHP